MPFVIYNHNRAKTFTSRLNDTNQLVHALLIAN